MLHCGQKSLDDSVVALFAGDHEGAHSLVINQTDNSLCSTDEVLDDSQMTKSTGNHQRAPPVFVFGVDLDPSCTQYLDDLQMTVLTGHDQESLAAVVLLAQVDSWQQSRESGNVALCTGLHGLEEHL